MSAASQLAQDLERLGLATGDRVVVHSSLRALGRVDGGAATVVTALRTVLGTSGTLVVPTFTYGVGLDAVVDQRTVPSRTGAVVEAVRALPTAVRSDHPTHSVTAVGLKATPLTCDHLATRAFGVRSPLSRVAEQGGKVLLLGVGHTSNSTVHVGEEHAGVPKPLPPEGLGTVEVHCVDGRVARCRLDTSPSCSAAFGVVESELRERGAIQDGLVGEALAQLMSGQAVIDGVAALVARRPDALLCTRSDCHPCSRTRTALGKEAVAC